jgi:hypothetical protein
VPANRWAAAVRPLGRREQDHFTIEAPTRAGSTISFEGATFDWLRDEVEALPNGGFVVGQWPPEGLGDPIGAAVQQGERGRVAGEVVLPAEDFTRGASGAALGDGGVAVTWIGADG